MVFITPEKFLYVETAEPLRRLLSRVEIEEIELLDEQSFDGLVTYPTITTVTNRPPTGPTLVRMRDRTERNWSGNFVSFQLARLVILMSQGTTMYFCCPPLSTM